MPGTRPRMRLRCTDVSESPPRGHVRKLDLAAQVGGHFFERFDEVVADPRAPRQARCAPLLAGQAEGALVGLPRPMWTCRPSHRSHSLECRQDPTGITWKP